MTSHQTSKGSLKVSAPSRVMAEIFASGAVSGTTTAHWMPSRRAFQATPWAMLPALAV